MKLLAVLSHKSAVSTGDWSKVTQWYTKSELALNTERQNSGCEEEVAVGELQRKMVRG